MNRYLRNSQAMKGSISLLVAAMLLAGSPAFANVEPVVKPGNVAKELQQAKTYTVSSAPTAPLELAAPTLPDLKGYTPKRSRPRSCAASPARSACAG